MSKKSLRWIISLVVLAILGWVFRDELDFLGEGLYRLRHAEPLPVAVAVITSLLALLAMAEVMRLLIRAGGMPVPLRETSAVTLASNAWSTTLPAGQAFSAILTYHIQRSWGASVALCGWFFVVSSVISTAWMVLIGLGAVIFLNANMALWSLAATLLTMIAMIAALFWLTNNPTKVESWLASRSWLKGDKKHAVAEQVRNLREVHLSARQFTWVSLYSLFNRLLDMLALWACVWAATGVVPTTNAPENSTTLAGVALAYITAKLAGSAQVTPAGLGTVEAAIIATLVATGMTAVDATSAAVIYRLISFALMTIIGWVVYFWHYARNGVTYEAVNADNQNHKQELKELK